MCACSAVHPTSTPTTAASPRPQEGHVWRATITVDPAAAAHIEYKAVLKCSDAPTVWEGGDNKGGDVEAGGAKVELYHEFTY